MKFSSDLRKTMENGTSPIENMKFSSDLRKTMENGTSPIENVKFAPDLRKTMESGAKIFAKMEDWRIILTRISRTGRNIHETLGPKGRCVRTDGTTGDEAS